MRPYLFAHGKLDLIGFTFPSCLHIPTFPGNFRLETALLFPSAPTEEMSDLRSPTETDETPRRLMSWTLDKFFVEGRRPRRRYVTSVRRGPVPTTTIFAQFWRYQRNRKKLLESD